MKKETWKDIPGYKDMYQVSDLGNVKSLLFGKEKIIKPTKTNGYWYVGLHNGKRKTFKVSALVVMAFLNHKPDGHKIVIDHINRIRTDDRLENLQLITNRENTSKDRKGISKYTGVVWHKKAKKWQSQININGEHKYIGIFVDEKEAAIAYQNALKIFTQKELTLKT